jgi:TPR repeat protein
MHGIGTDKNETKAFEWYLQSVQNGNKLAQNNLSYLYLNMKEYKYS